MLWGLVCLLIVLWILGYMTFSVGPLIHLLLVVALIVAIYNVVVGGRRTPPL